MVDFEGGKRGGFERDNGAEESLDLGSTNYQDAPANASAGTRILVPDASGTVTLPAGVSLDDITVQGRDLVVTLADGSTIVIPDGAIVFPQLVIDGATVEPLTLAALLNDALTPEAEPGQLPSSGGEFEDGEGFLQDAFDLGDLLPYTELPLGVEEEEEVIPFANSEPDIVIETPDNPVGVENAIATVAERGLPERGEPAEPEGTADETNAETTSGTIVFDAPDGLSAIEINGVEITTVGQEFVSPFGTLTITSIDLANGEIGFSYTLADNLLGETVDGFFEATVFDLDGDSATASLSIIVEDDSPIAAADIGIVPAGSHDPISGNVLDNDESGADDYPEGEEGPDAVTGFTSVETGATGEPGDTIQGEYGKLTLNADGSYTYVRDFNTPGGVTEDFTYTIIDQDGSTAQTTLTINIDDAGNEIEIPEIGDGTIVEESGLPERGDPAEPEGTDEPSDGETTSGTITFNSPDGVGSITINGVELDLGNEAGNDADDQTVIDDETGTLVITSVTYDPATGDGTITYEYTLGDNTLGDQDVDGGNTTVPFDVVITDLDDDTAEDTLVITIVDDAPFIEANEEEPALEVDETDFSTDDTVSFAGAFDITPGADGLSSVDYELGITAAASGLVDTLSGEAVVLSVTSEGVVEGRTETGGELVFTVSVDGDGNVTLDQSRAVEHPNTANHDDPISLADELVTLTATATDGDGDTADATINIGDNLTFRDDGPVIDAAVVDGDIVRLNTQDAETRGADTDTATSTANFSGAFSVASSDFGADGEGSVVWDYSLDVVDGDSGLSSDGDPITLSLVGGVVEGRTSGGVLVFDIAVDAATGIVTLNQYAELDHPLPGDDSDYDQQELPLPTGLVNLVGEATITDGDGDTASDTETLDLGGNIVFDDDGPSIDAAVVDGDEIRLNTQDAETRGDDTDTASSMADFSGSFTIGSSDFGADGAGVIEWNYSLDVTAVDGASGLSSDGDPITLTLVGGVVEGRTSGGVLVFDIAVDATTGVVTLNQYEELDHPLPGDDSDYDLQELALGTGLVNLVGEATITDGDGDTASDTEVLDLGGNIVFDDDGPSVNVTEDEAELEVDESDFDTNDTKNFAGSFDIDYGADGEGSVAYTLGVVAGPSGLTDTLSGEAVILSLTAGGVVEGRTETGGELVFTVSVDGDGNVTLDQSRAVVHADPTDHDDPVSLTDDLVTLTATATDGDGDTADATINIGENLTFRDDGPSIDAAVVDGDTVRLNTQDAETRGADTDTATSTANFSGAFSIASSDFGADGEGSIVWDYSLDVVEANSGLSSDGDPITLYLIGGKVVGSTATDVNDVDDTNTVFDISVVASTGVVTLNQYAELDHELPGDDSDYDQQELPLPTGLVNLVGEATITDGDGDTASDTATLDLGGNIVFDDDGPSVVADGPEAELEVDETNFGFDDTKDFSGAFSVDFGADGAGTVDYTLDVVDGPSGLIDTVSGEAVILSVNMAGVVEGRTETGGELVFTVSVDGDGNVTLDQSRAVVHADAGDHDDPVSLADELVTLTATATDGDGDTAEDTINIGDNLTFRDDGPSIALNDQFVAPSLEVDETNLDVDDDGNAFAGAFTSDFGADEEGSIDYSLVITIGGDSGLVDVATGESILLYYDGDDVVGRVIGGVDDGEEAFRVSVDEFGNVSLDQSRALVHGDTADHDDPVSPDAGSIQLLAVITDGDGDQDDAILDLSDGIVFRDDGPEAFDNSNSLGEGEDVSGNVVDDVDPSGTDESGADGYAVDGPVVDADFVSGEQGITFTSKDVAPDGTITIVTSAGTLVLNTDGSYTFDADANTVNADADIVFTYTIEDGDGDQSTANLTITIDNVAGFVEDDDAYVDEGGLPDVGTGELNSPADDVDLDGEVDQDPESDQSEIDANGSIRAVDGLGNPLTGDFTYSLDDVSATPGPGPNEVTLIGDYGTLVLNTETGDYTYTLTTRYDHEDGNGENDSPADADSFDYTVTDEFGNEIGKGSIDVTIRDDIPVIEAELDSGSTVSVDETDMVQGDATIDLDGNTQGSDSDVSGSPTIVSGTTAAGGNGVFNITTLLYGADGEAAGGGLDYDLVVNSSVSGLSTTEGDPIVLVAHSTDSNVVLGMVDGTDTVAFAIEIDDATGELTVEQYLSLHHTQPTDDLSLQLTAGSLQAVVSATDGDADEVSIEAIDITSLITFLDDDPSVVLVKGNGELSVDEENLAQGSTSLDLAGFGYVQGSDNDVTGTPTIVSSSPVVLTSVTTADYGADGEGTPDITYSLSLDNVDGTTTTVSTLLETTEEQSISLVKVSDTLVLGVINGGNTVAFAIILNADTGAVTLEQYVSLEHGDNTPATDVVALALGDLYIGAAITDGDNDTTDVDYAAVGSAISFGDDLPNVEAEVDSGSTVSVDETDMVQGSATIDLDGNTQGSDDDVTGSPTIVSGSTTPGGNGVLNLTTLDFGADGEAATGSVNYNLLIGNSTSGLSTTEGTAINLVGHTTDSNIVLGMVEGTDIVAFAIEIDDTTGEITIEQYLSLQHTQPTDDLSLQLDEGSLLATVTIKDGDEDIDTTDGVDITSLITFLDDDPAVVIATNGNDISVDESNLAVANTTLDLGSFTQGTDADVADGLNPTLIASVATSLTTLTTEDYGADGEGSPDLTYKLSLDDGDTLTELATSLQTTEEQAITLVKVSDTVVVGEIGDTGVAAFAISIDADTGEVTLEQYVSVEHGDNVPSTNSVSLALSQLFVGVTIEDGDEDTATDYVDVGGSISFLDDTPTGGSNPTIQLDDDNWAGSDGNVGVAGDATDGAGSDDIQSVSTSGTLNHDFGNDGGSIAFATTGAPVGFRYQASGSDILIQQEQGTDNWVTVVTVTLNPATGAYTVTQNNNVLHDNADAENNVEFTLSYTVTDGDEDTAPGTLVINVDDDTPIANDDSDTIAPGGTAADGNVISGVGTDNPVTGEDLPGADQPVAISELFHAGTTELDSDSTGGFTVNGTYGVLTMQADGSYEYDRFVGSAGGVQDVFTYTIVDQDGDTSEATLTINIGDLTPMAADGEAQLDDDGLPTANKLVGANDIDADAIDMNGSERIFDGLLGGSGGDGALSYSWQPIPDAQIGQETVTFLVTPDGLSVLAVVTSSPDNGRVGTPLFEAEITDASTGAFSITLLNNVLHNDDANEDEDGVEIGTALTYRVTDVDGDFDDGVIDIDFNDDVPTLGPIVDQGATNEPGDPVIVGDLNLSAGADGLGNIVIEADVSTLTVGGKPLLTQQVGNVLTAYADTNEDGFINDGATEVFTITVDPDAGGTGTYTFDLITPLDGQVTDVPIGGSTAFGAGPDEQGQALDDGDPVDPTILSVVSGYNTDFPGSTWDPLTWFVENGPDLDVNGIETGGVNGATAGWGIDNNNLNEGQLFVWDFSSGALENPDGPGVGFEPPANVTLPDVTFATFSFKGASDTEVVQMVVRFTDGTSVAVEVTGADLDTDANGPYTYTAPGGKIIDSIEMYGETLGGGGTKVELVSVGVQDESIDVDIPVTITATDGDGDTVSTDFDINISDNVPAISNLIASINGGEGSLDEDDLADGTDQSDPTTLNGTFTISAPDGLDDLVVGGETVIVNGTFVGGAIMTPLGTLTITGYNAGTGEVSYTYQLQSNADHSGGDVFDNFTVELTDTDGDADGDTLSIKIVDDAPIVTNDTAQVVVGTNDFNTAFVLDFSGSISNSELNTMLQAVETAITTLFNGTSGDVTVRFVAFSHGSPSNGALNYGPFTDLTAAIAQLDALNPNAGGTRPYNGRTNFTEAVLETANSFVPDADAINQIFFLSDGKPNEGLGSGGATFTSSASTIWNDFVNNNDISVTSIGIGGGINLSRLQDVDVDGEGAPILVNDFSDIVDALLDSIIPGEISGEVLANDELGADGARIDSIEIDGVTYSWDGASTIFPSNGNNSIAGTVVTVETAFGGDFVFNFSDGSWTYQPPAGATGVTDEVFTYTLVDGDGSIASGTLTITVAEEGAIIPPVVLDLQGDGADAFVGLDAGVAYDFDGDGVKTKTAWIAAGAAILAYDANANGMVDGAGEFVFGDADTTDLEAILAKFDTNDNAVLDAGDAEYGKFGVWMDDGDGVYEDGEFKSLEDAGIASIDLELNGIGGDAADGDVEIFNTVNFTYTDGNTGTAYDAAFELGGDVLDTSAASMDALLAMADETSPSDDTGTKSVEGSQSETPEATEIVKDVLAENVVDAMLDAISGDHGIQPSHAAITMASDVLMKSIDTGAFAFDSGVAADMTDEAAAMAAMNA